MVKSLYPSLFLEVLHYPIQCQDTILSKQSIYLIWWS